MRTAITIIVFLLLASVVHGESGRVLRKQAIVPAPPEKVFAAWTTADGANAFFGRDAKIELSPGGAYEIYFDPSQPAGARGSEGCRVLCFIPNQMLAFEWNAPPRFGDLRNQRTCVILTFKDLGDGRTQIDFTQAGWGDSPQWDELYNYFDRAWSVVLDRLASHLSSAK